MLARRQTLPLKPVPVSLTGRYVRLEPVIPKRDAQPLFAVSNGSPATLRERTLEPYDNDALIWRYMFHGPFSTQDNFTDYLQEQCSVPNALSLCVFDVPSGRQVGITNFMNNSPDHLKIELGGIWYSPLVQRTKANTEATYLMLNHAFDLGYRRLEWKCHAHNQRSRRAALRMGFQFEGIQQNHMIIKGHSRDTAWFRILDTEWSGVKSHLESLLYGVDTP